MAIGLPEEDESVPMFLKLDLLQCPRQNLDPLLEVVVGFRVKFTFLTVLFSINSLLCTFILSLFLAVPVLWETGTNT